MLNRLLAVVCLIGFGFVAQAQDMTVDQILAKSLENTGGEANWKKLNTMRMTGTMSMQGMEFAGVVTMMRPNMQRVDVDIQGQKLIQSYDGTDAWWLFPMQTGPTAQPMPEEMATDFTKEQFEDDFINYKEKGHTVELIGTAEVEGAPTYEVKLTKKNGDVEYHYFDQEYFVPIMQKTEVSQGPMKGQYMETYLSDYQEVEGMMVPFFMETKAGGQTVQKMTMSKVEMNPEVETTLFSRPKE